MSELQYPFVNVPPIVYNQPLATLHESSSFETYSDYQPGAIGLTSASKPDTPITFVPANGNGELVAIEGTFFHPNQHVLTKESFKSSTRVRARSRGAKDSCDPEKHADCEPKPKSNPEMAKYYVAGLSVVGLVILYRFMSKSEY